MQEAQDGSRLGNHKETSQKAEALTDVEPDLKQQQPFKMKSLNLAGLQSTASAAVAVQGEREASKIGDNELSNLEETKAIEP